jgi:hypothetical protein
MVNRKEAFMSDRVWGHCQHCKHFGSPARIPIGNEEAACQHPTLVKYQLLVFGAGGCNCFELRPGLAETDEQPTSDLISP